MEGRLRWNRRPIPLAGMESQDDLANSVPFSLILKGNKTISAQNDERLLVAVQCLIVIVMPPVPSFYLYKALLRHVFTLGQCSGALKDQSLASVCGMVVRVSSR